MPNRTVEFSNLSDAARHVWAKTSDDGKHHGVLQHLLDVAASAAGLLARLPEEVAEWAANELRLPPECSVAESRAWISLLVGLHDIGKATAGFQAKSEAGRDEDEANGLSFDGAILERDRHDMASAHFLRRRLVLLGASPDWAVWTAHAVAGHHGEVPNSEGVRQSAPLGEDAMWASVREEIFDAYLTTLRPPGALRQEPPSVAGVMWLAGLTSVSDWVGSNIDLFPLGERAVDTAGHYVAATRLAASAFDAIGWHTHGQLGAEPGELEDLDALISRMVMQQVAARPLQQRLGTLLKEGKGAALVLVEAPMGEGKTEAAFLGHLLLQARNQHRGMYVALPTQATGNAMFLRATTFLQAFGGDNKIDIQLAHGGASMTEDFAAMVYQVGSVNASPTSAVAASEWFTKRKRPLLSPYGVGTVDQALLSAMYVPHHFVRLFGLAHKTIVLDEVHAYDSYTGGLIEGLLRHLRRMGCSVLLMSATLPTARRQSMLKAWTGSDEPTPPAEYPRVTVCDDAGMRADTFSCRAQQPVAIAGCGESIDAIAEVVMERLAGGGCGAVIVNTVKRAQELHVVLSKRLRGDVPLLLFHARFPADERRQHELAVLDALGKDSQRPARALLIATQVAEQSLDIDADWLLSDLAPMDLLLQRVGRLHRHARSGRPDAHATPVLTVAGLHTGRLPELKKTGWAFVYSAYTLLRTWALLVRTDSMHLPLDIDRLVQLVYGDEPFEWVTPLVTQAMADARNELLAQQKKQSSRASNALVKAGRPLDETYGARNLSGYGTDEQMAAVTRDGEESIAIVPLFAVPAGWAVHRDGQALADLDHPGPATSRALYCRQFRLSRPDVVAAMSKPDYQGTPTGWQRVAILRGLVALRLTSDAAVVAGSRLRLDDELGVVITSAK